MRLAEEALAENERRRDEISPGRHPRAESLEQELRLLYARGDLDRESFVEMRELAKLGRLSPADLGEARRQAAQVRALDSPEAREAAVALARLRRQEKALESARGDSEAGAARMEAQVTDLETRATRDEEDARAVVLKDEERARALLEHREAVLEDVRRIRESVSGLRQDIQRMEDLQRQLKLQEQELEATLARTRLGSLERDIRGEKGRHGG